MPEKNDGHLGNPEGQNRVPSEKLDADIHNRGPIPEALKPRLLPLARDISAYARRWAVTDSTVPEDVIAYDTCITILIAETGGEVDPNETTAQADRALRVGVEPYSGAFSLPTVAKDAIVILHRFARRYSNGRGAGTSGIINAVARELISHGVSLAETYELDGTIWAADGVGGAEDGLTPQEREEARSALTRNGNGGQQAE